MAGAGLGALQSILRGALGIILHSAPSPQPTPWPGAAAGHPRRSSLGPRAAHLAPSYFPLSAFEVYGPDSPRTPLSLYEDIRPVSCVNRLQHQTPGWCRKGPGASDSASRRLPPREEEGRTIRTANAHDLGFWGDGAQSGRGSSNKGAMRRGFVGSSQWVVGCRRPLQEM